MIPMSEADSSSSIVLSEQIDIVKSTARKTLEEKVNPSRADGPYQGVLELIEQMETLSEHSVRFDYSASSLYNAFRDMLKKIARHQDYFDKLRYGNDRTSDSVENLLSWFKLHSSSCLQEQQVLEYEKFVRKFNEFRIDTSHNESANVNGSDPVLRGILILLWRTIEDIIEIWGRLIAQSEADRDLYSYVNRLWEEGHTGFINTLKEDHGYITTYQMAEIGNSVKFNVNDVSYFPTVGDIVIVEYDNDPTSFEDTVDAAIVSKL